MDDDMDIDVVADENGQQIQNSAPSATNRAMDVPLEEDDDHTYSGSSNGSSYGEDEDGVTMVEFKKKNFNATPAVRAAPVELPTNTDLRVKVNKLFWKWIEGGDDTCGICRMAFEACCVDCKCPGDECPLVLGQCKHPFHMHCIVKWTDAQNTPKPQCPLCRQEWKFAE
ncbi:unnamed protein product [Angiostrongylus costaricensis]|uniref:Anaphase-promoting complex subunit 11 n=1 Tax=Angiostrongylus costaricensis TaxID=334426 RepID=A0A0R3PMM7_ANGCS|nr:unnamed protein product [Angiostrongylus costaricensis]